MLCQMLVNKIQKMDFVLYGITNIEQKTMFFCFDVNSKDLLLCINEILINTTSKELIISSYSDTVLKIEVAEQRKHGLNYNPKKVSIFANKIELFTNFIKPMEGKHVTLINA